MKKYSKLRIRPAGESDDYDSDSDGFEFDYKDSKPKKTFGKFNKPDSDDEKPNLEDITTLEKESVLLAKRNLEFDVYQACISGDDEFIRKYITDGHDIDEYLHTGWTPMLYAASSMLPGMIQLLIDLGANPNKHKDGYTPLMALCHAQKNCSEEEAMNCLDILINSNVDPNATSKNRENALMFAVNHRHPEFVKKLATLTKSINLTDSEGNTVLHYAVFYNRIEIVKLLLEFNVDTEIKNRHFMTAYEYAVAKQFKDIIDLLHPDTNIDSIDYELKHITKWQDLFPNLSDVQDDKVIQDISTILFGMGLEMYTHLFKGMTLKTFLNLTDEDLKKLGMDLSIHRQRFIDDLYKFHSHRWNAKTIGYHKTKKSYNIFDGVISLGNILKKFCIIGSSFKYIRQHILDSETKTLLLTPQQKKEYEIELVRTEGSIKMLQKELINFKNVSKQIKSEACESYPATHIFKKKKYIQWPIFLAISTILGFYIFKSRYVQTILQNN